MAGLWDLWLQYNHNWYDREWNDDGYHYYDTPEGEDYLKKCGRLLHFSIRPGYTLAAMDLLFISKPQSILAGVQRFAYIVSPFVFLPITYVTAIHVITNVRKNDNIVNSAIAGAVTGIALGMYKKNALLGFNAAVLGGAHAAGMKYGRNHLGWKIQGFFPWRTQHLNDEYGLFYSHKTDFSMFAERPKGWIKAEDLAKQEIAKE